MVVVVGDGVEGGGGGECLRVWEMLHQLGCFKMCRLQALINGDYQPRLPTFTGVLPVVEPSSVCGLVGVPRDSPRMGGVGAEMAAYKTMYKARP